METLPKLVTDEEMLDDLLSRPSPALVSLMRRLEGDLLILGIAGKMGATLGRMAVRAIQHAGVAKRVIGVSRFSDPASRATLEAWGIETLPCDLLDPEAVATLPQAPQVIYMAGRKFGTQGQEGLTWASNTIMPAHVARHYAHSRIVAFSTGCVYPLVPVTSGGCTEENRPDPVGEYAQSCLGRERIFEHFSRAQGTPVCLLRLNYALDLRYGVLHDLAQTIHAGEPVSLTVSHFNGIWQGDANLHALLALEACASPPAVFNLTGPETVSVRWVAELLAEQMGVPVTFTDAPGSVAYLSNAANALHHFGYPRVSLRHLIAWTAHWVKSGGRSLGKPTHFEVRDGKF